MLRMLGLNLWVKWRKGIEFLRVVRRYYGNWEFVKQDMRLGLSYLGKSPYLVSKEYLMGRGEKDVHVYGETPLTTLEKIARESGVGAGEKVYELGCGTGRTCLWLKEFIGCEVVGVERNPTFVGKARKLIRGVEFREGDFFAQDYEDADVVYLYGTCMDDLEAQQIARVLQVVKEGARVVSVSFPLEGFEVVKHFSVRFTWGEADVYVQRFC